MSQLGLAKYTGEKAEKYSRVLKLYQQREDVSPERGLHRERPWIQVKAFSLTYPGV